MLELEGDIRPKKGKTGLHFAAIYSESQKTWMCMVHIEDKQTNWHKLSVINYIN